jgi:hypothetical protein
LQKDVLQLSLFAIFFIFFLLKTKNTRIFLLNIVVFAQKILQKGTFKIERPSDRLKMYFSSLSLPFFSYFFYSKQKNTRIFLLNIVVFAQKILQKGTFKIERPSDGLKPTTTLVLAYKYASNIIHKRFFLSIMAPFSHCGTENLTQITSFSRFSILFPELGPNNMKTILKGNATCRLHIK